MPSSHDINRILVRGARWIGDAVMTVPALRALRHAFPRAHITLAAGAWAKDLFLDADFVDDVLSFEAGEKSGRARRVWREAREWQAGEYDLVALFQNAFAAALTARLAGIPHRIGYATDGRGFLLTDALPVPAWRAARHELFYYLNIVAGIERKFTGRVFHATRDPEASLAVSPARQAGARDLLRRYNLNLPQAHTSSPDLRPLVVLCPGSTNSRAKRWSADAYAALADQLIEAANANVLLIGAAAERDVSERVARLMRRRPLVLTGETTLAESVAVISLASLIISNDTGPAHIAGALGRPTLVIFGPTNPVTTRPYSASAEVIREPPLCAPCMLRECPIDHRCMTRVTPERVYTSALKLLSQSANETGTLSVKAAR